MQLSATHRLGGIASPATSSNRGLPAAARLAVIAPRLLKPAGRIDQWSPAAPVRHTAVAGLFGGKGDPVPELTPDSPEQVMLRSTAGLQRTLGAIAFWVQLALSLSAAFILLFSVAFTSPAARNSDVTKWLTLIGVATAFLSTFFAHGFRTLAKKLQDGGIVARGWLVSNALGNNTLNLIGIFALVIGLQASVGTLVAKTLLTSAQTPFVGQQGSMLVSLDVFSLQASTNSLLSHVISLIYTNVLLGLVNKTLPKDSTTTPSEVDN